MNYERMWKALEKYIRDAYHFQISSPIKWGIDSIGQATGLTLTHHIMEVMKAMKKLEIKAEKEEKNEQGFKVGF